MKLDSLEKIKLHLKENPNTHVIGENGEIYYLEGEELIIKASKDNNSWERVSEWRNLLTNHYKNYPFRKEYKEAWDLLESHYEVIDREVKVAKTPLNAMLYYLEMGFYPPPEIMLSVADCFEQYMLSGGKIELEEIFFGKTQRGVGNYSARKNRKSIIQFLDFRIMDEELKSHLPNSNKAKSHISIAEEVINTFNSKEDPENLLRRYRRFKQKTS